MAELVGDSAVLEIEPADAELPERVLEALAISAGAVEVVLLRGAENLHGAENLPGYGRLPVHRLHVTYPRVLDPSEHFVGDSGVVPTEIKVVHVELAEQLLNCRSLPLSEAYRLVEVGLHFTSKVSHLNLVGDRLLLFHADPFVVVLRENFFFRRIRLYHLAEKMNGSEPLEVGVGLVARYAQV